mgnify:CR=1 FL=1
MYDNMTDPYQRNNLAYASEQAGIKQKLSAEMNSLKMHATMMTTTPSIIYWLPGTIDIMHTILKLREEGIKAYFTMDAGPNVKIICLDKDVKKIEKELLKLPDVIKTITCKPGKSAYISTDHLF